MTSVELSATAAKPEAAALLEHLEEELKKYRSLLVAFSGGVDSAVLLAVAHRVLGTKVIALTADSPSIAREELRKAREFASSRGIRHLVIETDELENPEYAANDINRCYFCKKTLFSTAEQVARDLEITDLAYGYTADDVGDVRPGHVAAEEFAVHAPLHAAGLGKKEIRAIAHLLDLDVAEKPAAPCLASRIPYGSQVTVAKLGTIEAMESLLRELGFAICRARWDGSLMRIEVEAHRVAEVSGEPNRTKILERARELGVALVTIDLEGFASGKLNRRGLV